MRVLIQLGYVRDSQVARVDDDVLDLQDVPFASVLNMNLDFLGANRGRAFGYMVVQKRTRKEAVGRVKWARFRQEPNASLFVETVPNIQTNTIMFNQAHSLELIETFNQDAGLYPVDAVLHFNIYGARPFAFQLSTPGRFVPTVVRLEKAVLQDGKFYDEPDDEFLDWLRTTGALGSSLIFLSEKQRSYYLKNLMKFLSASSVRKIRERSAVIPNGIDVPLCDRVVTEVAAPTDRSVGFFGRLIEVKGLEMTFPLYEKLRVLGKIDRVTITAPVKGSVEPPAGADVHLGLGKEYLRHARSVKACIHNSKNESFNVTLVETMAVGVIPVVPRLPWAYNLLDEETYPFFYSNEDEAAAKLLRALDEYERWSEWCMAYARQHFDRARTAAEWFNLVQTAVESSSPVYSMDAAALKKKYKFLDKVEDAAAGLADGFTLGELLGKIGGLPRFMMGPVVSLSEFAHMVKALGYKDTLDSVEPKYVRA